MTKKKQRSKRALRPEELTETDLAQDKMGRNALQGRDQSQVHNQRHAVPDAKLETDSVMESLEKTDKDVRARRDLGKGARKSGAREAEENESN